MTTFENRLQEYNYEYNYWDKKVYIDNDNGFVILPEKIDIYDYIKFIKYFGYDGLIDMISYEYKISPKCLDGCLKVIYEEGKNDIDYIIKHHKISLEDNNILYLCELKLELNDLGYNNIQPKYEYEKKLYNTLKITLHNTIGNIDENASSKLDKSYKNPSLIEQLCKITNRNKKNDSHNWNLESYSGGNCRRCDDDGYQCICCRDYWCENCSSHRLHECISDNISDNMYNNDGIFRNL